MLNKLVNIDLDQFQYDTSCIVIIVVVINMLKKVLLSFIFIFCGTSAFSQAYWCEVKPNSFNRAAGAAKISPTDVKSWMPSVFSINAEKAKFWKGVEYEVSGGDRISTFQVRNRATVNGVIYNDTYYVKINAFAKTGTVILQSPGYHPIGPVRYKCEPQGNSKSSTVSNSESDLKIEFSKLSSCNKKYLQQFLKGQGLYFGGIDGLWGQGTERAVEAALKLPTFKNETVAGFFKKITRNPVCN